MAIDVTRPDETGDRDPRETREWLDALDAVVRFDGAERAEQLLGQVVDRARLAGVGVGLNGSTPYVNTIPAGQEPEMPGDPEIEQRLRSLIRWNAMAIVLGANRDSSELGGHIASYQSAATLYEIGFNHFWHAPGSRGALRQYKIVDIIHRKIALTVVTMIRSERAQTVPVCGSRVCSQHAESQRGCALIRLRPVAFAMLVSTLSAAVQAELRGRRWAVSTPSHRGAEADG